ncbi:hypothetical protein HY311_03170 [Candidatus Nomurabacteria bacterium]|nr:hypothetical protein [Candidatus Nomurabacteria bacterium]
MNEKGDFGGIPQRKGRKEEPRPLNPEIVAYKNKLDSLVERHGEKAVMSFIENDTGGTVQSVVEGWLSGKNSPSLSIQGGIMRALDYLKTDPDILPTIPTEIKDTLVDAPESSNIPLARKPEYKRLTRKEIMEGGNEDLKEKELQKMAAEKRAKDRKEKQKAERLAAWKALRDRQNRLIREGTEPEE